MAYCDETQVSFQEKDEVNRLLGISFTELAANGAIDTITRRLIPNPTGGPSFVATVPDDIIGRSFVDEKGFPQYDVNSVTDEEPHTALFYAIQNNYPAVTALLLRHGATLNDADQSALMTPGRVCCVM